MDAVLLLLAFLPLTIIAESTLETFDRIIEGQKLTLICPFKNIHPDGIFRWSFKPHNKNEYEGLCVKQVKDIDCVKSAWNWKNFIEMNTFTLIIDKVTSTNAGTYMCRYMDGNNLDIHKFKVNILTPPGKPQIESIPTTLIENQPVQLTCKSEGGNPKPSLQWSWKDFSSNPISKERRINSTFSKTNGTYGLVILSTTWYPKSIEDANSISCQAINALANVSSNWMYLNINYPPIIYDFPSKVNYGLIGDEISIECKTTSKSTVTYKWINEKGQIYSNGSYLIISPLRMSDKGSYKCVVTNSIGTSSATLDIKVLLKPIINVQESVIVNEWETLHLKCNAVPPISNVTWWLEDKIISETNELNYEIKRKQSFEIQCRASVSSNSYRDRSLVTSSKKTVKVIVQYIPSKPTILANPDGTMKTGSDVTLTCLANETNPGYPKPEYSWTKRNSNWSKNGTNFLTLSFLKFEEAGMYSCKLFNKIGPSEESLYDLNIEGQPAFGGTKTRFPKTLFIRVGISFKIDCRFEARPHPNIKWFINGILIKNNSTRIRSETAIINDYLISSTIHIEEPNAHSEENYRCTGENKYGSLSNDYIVRVTYPPKIISTIFTIAANVTTNPVSYLEAVNLNCSVTATPNISILWIRKLINHNEKTIENDTDKYLILERHLDAARGLESILYILNFQSEDYGKYLCISKNSEGHIEKDFDIRKFSIPDLAHNLAVVNKSLTSLTIKWTPGFDGGYEQYFTVSYHAEAQKHPIQIRTRDSVVKLTNLLPDVVYIVNISSSNELGTSASTRFIKDKTLEIIDREQIFFVNKEEKVIEFELPSNMSEMIYCLSIEQMDIQKDLVGEWIPIQRCARQDIKKIKIDNPYDRFRVKICLRNFPDVCTNMINQRLDTGISDAMIPTKLIGTVAAICAALAVVLVILLTLMLTKSRKFFPVISDLKGIKRNRKSSYSKDENSNFNAKSTPLCPKKQPFIKEPGICPLLSTYSCDQMHMAGNPIEILNVCPPHNMFSEGLYPTLVKSSSISPFPYTLTSNNIIHQTNLNTVSSCCCHDDQQVFSMSLPASRITKPEKIIYEVMV